MDTLLKIAKERYNIKSKTISNYNVNMMKFVLLSYIHLDPACYGKQIEKKLKYDLDKSLNFKIVDIEDSYDKGDMGFRFPAYDSYSDPDSGYYYNELFFKMYYDKLVFNNFYEIKVSFLGKNDGYTIRNIRKHQELDGYILMTVDCENDFNIEYYFLTSEDLFNNCGLTFSYMNGTKKSNDNNKIVGVGTQFKKNSNKHYNIKSHSKLKTPTYEGLVEFINEERNKHKELFKHNLKECSDDFFKNHIQNFKSYSWR